MKKILVSVLFVINIAFGQIAENKKKLLIPLDSKADLEIFNVKVEEVNDNGGKGIQVSKVDGEIEGQTLVVIPEIIFKNGIIEVELSGEPASDAAPQMRGFVGIAFRVNSSDYNSYECFYLRPTNGRSDNQLQRNHSTQYISHPEFPWQKLRNESPGVYESYADLVPGEWIKIMIEVQGTRARLFVNNSEQPSLIVNDLKHGESEGKLALWLHSSTVARFRNLILTRN